MPELVCLGIIVADVWARPVETWPPRGTLGLVEEIGIGLGGCAANTAIDFTRLGGEAAVIGCVGNDGLGDFAVNILEQVGVQLAVQRSESAPTSGTLISISPDGERTFLHCPGANGSIDPARIDMDLIASARILHLAGVFVMPNFDGEPQAEVLAEAQRRGVTTLVDTVYDGAGRWMSLLQPLLPYTDIFLPSYNEARELTGEEAPGAMAQVFLEAGVELAGIKLGPEGSYFRTAEREIRLPAYPVETVDGSGAGDAFVAGFVFGWLRGWDLADIGRFANAVGGLATTATGTTRGVCSYEETVRLLEQWEGKKWSVSS